MQPTTTPHFAEFQRKQRMIKQIVESANLTGGNLTGDEFFLQSAPIASLEKALARFKETETVF